MVELLTVIAIIAVLATLVSASLANAQRKGRKAVCISNLRQIVIAFNLYMDDRDKRPETFRQMVQARYLNERVLICPEDRVVKNWAGELEKLDSAKKAPVAPISQGEATTAPPDAMRGNDDLPHSYFKSFDYHDDVWAQIDANPMAGLFACQLHGVGRQRKDELPSLSAYQGLVLRALKDGSVVSRQVFWEDDISINFGGNTTDAPTAFPGAPMLSSGSSQLPLFLYPAQ